VLGPGPRRSFEQGCAPKLRVFLGRGARMLPEYCPIMGNTDLGRGLGAGSPSRSMREGLAVALDDEGLDDEGLDDEGLDDEGLAVALDDEGLDE
jgi:hypothetical protein